MARRAIALGVVAAGAAFGVFTLSLARAHPDFWFAGESAVTGVALLAAGCTLIGAGVVSWLRRPRSPAGPLLCAAGLAWFVLEWNNPETGSALTFTLGLVFFVAAPPLVAHAVLALTGGRTSQVERVALGLGYVTTLLVLGLLPALLFDPVADACSECPRNLVLVTDAPRIAGDLDRVGLRLAVVAAAALAVVLLLRLQHAPATARPVLIAGAAYEALVAGMFASYVDRGLLTNGETERRLWLGQAVALVGLGAGLGWSLMRARRARAEVARLVVELSQAPPPGGLREALAGIVRDPELGLAYPVGEPERLVDADGNTVELRGDRQRTSLVLDGRTVAVVSHTPGLLGDEQIVDEVTAAARLALENERLHAELRARLAELRASRARIVEAGDAERKRLERDLHDGAQQRLVGLSLSMRLARSQLPQDGAAVLEDADAELRTAIEELRGLAHGIFPAVLADEGLAAAVEALAEESPVPVRIRGLPEGRIPAAVESAAYTIVAEVSRSAGGVLDVWVGHRDGVLLVEVEAESADGMLDLVGLEDRVGALDGRISVECRADRVQVCAELPCES